MYVAWTVDISGTERIWKLPLCNFAASAAPTTGDDADDGYDEGSLWCDTTANLSYQCLDASVGAAVWNLLSQASILTVDRGGTGLATLTPYAVLCGGTTATGPIQQVSGLGTVGQVLTSNGPGLLASYQDPSGGAAGTVSIVCLFDLSGNILYETGFRWVSDLGAGEWRAYFTTPMANNTYVAIPGLTTTGHTGLSPSVRNKTINYCDVLVCQYLALPDETLLTHINLLITGVQDGGGGVGTGTASDTGTGSAGGGGGADLLAWFKLDEGTGLTAADSSANNNTASLVNSPTWVADAPAVTGFGYSLECGPTDEQAAAGDIAAYHLGSGDWTMGCFVKFNSIGQDIFFAQDEGFGALEKWWFGIDHPGTTETGFHMNGSSGAVSLLRYTWSRSTDIWYHVAITRSGSTWKLFIDGVEVMSETYSGDLTNPTSDLTIGYAEPGFALDGKICDVRIYGRALTGTELGNWHTTGTL